MTLWQPCYNDPFLRPICRRCTILYWAALAWSAAAVVAFAWVMFVRLIANGWGC